MATTVPRFLFWAPRLLCILFAVFLSLFALDAFDEGGSAWKTALAFLIHLFPAALVALVLVLSWRHELVGAITFLVLGVLYIVSMWARFPWFVYVGISGPLFVISALFLANWSLKRGGTAAGLQH